MSFSSTVLIASPVSIAVEDEMEVMIRDSERPFLIRKGFVFASDLDFINIIISELTLDAIQIDRIIYIKNK